MSILNDGSFFAQTMIMEALIVQSNPYDPTEGISTRRADACSNKSEHGSGYHAKNSCMDIVALAGTQL